MSEPAVPDRPAAWNLPALRARLAESSAGGGRTWWRSLEQIADAPEFREMLHREFPERASEWDDGVSRRHFLQVMGASLALAGLTACSRPREGDLVPYVKQPEILLPGRPLYFATAVTLGGFATGVLVESHMGRPTKIEGNPDHPASLGATDVYTQAEILGLYDPDRARTITFRGAIRPWSDFVNAMQDERTRLVAAGGRGLAILTGHVTSPTLAAQIDSLLAEMPQARWHQWEPVAQRDNARAGAIAAFGRDVVAIPRFEDADVVVSLDSDFLSEGASHVRDARRFTARRKAPLPGAAGTGSREMNRLYVFESCPSPTGAVADHRWRVRASRIAPVARALAQALGLPGLPAGAGDEPAPGTTAAIAADLRAHTGRSLVLAGAHQPAEVHALAHAMNAALGNIGRTVRFIEPVEAHPESHVESIRALAAAMKAGQVEALLVLGGNPVYDAPADLDFAAAMESVKSRVHLGLHADETAARAHWQIPAAHELEAWTDARAFDGTVSLVQPLIEPLYGGRTAHEVLAALTGKPLRSGYDLLRDSWTLRLGGVAGGFETAWRRALHDGFVAETGSAPVDVALDPGWAGRLAPARTAGPPAEGGVPLPAGELELVFRPDPSVYDGRFANNGWLQELPRPMTKLTWDNAVLVSPHTAETIGAANGDVVSLSAGGRSLEGPLWILPGHPDGAATLHLGSGRTRAGRVGNGAGFDAGALRTSDAPWIVPRAGVTLAGRQYLLAVTQEHGAMEGRELVRSAPLAHFEDHPDFAKHMGGHEPAPDQTLFEPHPYDRYAWGMTIDLSSCIGCNACTIACVAENNIPVVGKDQVSRGREMHWIRVDRYFEGELDDPEIWHQPVTCMQCENAPCEQVCPVAATVHSEEGLNDMVYNRCVGTRYCSNNCPYKVRRFNFFAYADFEEPSLKLLRNPDVTVRSRGVMEKCTYCVQRINQARNDAEAAGRRIGDGDIVTACQQACPASAITFGDINDPASRVSAAKADPRNYGLLTELNTRPRTTYLAAVRNPNPQLVRKNPSTSSGHAPPRNSGHGPEGPA